MDDFFVFMICHTDSTSREIKGFFEEEDSLTITATSENHHMEWVNITGVASADLVLLMEKEREDLVKRLCVRWNILYAKAENADAAKEIIAEKFIEWSDERGT
jgi:hypothetical protein